MDNEPTIHLHCVRKNGRLETTTLTHHTLPLARELAKRVLQAGDGLYTKVHICTDDGYVETRVVREQDAITTYMTLTDTA